MVPKKQISHIPCSFWNRLGGTNAASHSRLIRLSLWLIMVMSGLCSPSSLSMLLSLPLRATSSVPDPRSDDACESGDSGGGEFVLFRNCVCWLSTGGASVRVGFVACGADEEKASEGTAPEEVSVVFASAGCFPKFIIVAAAMSVRS